LGVASVKMELSWWRVGNGLCKDGTELVEGWGWPL
jgi:hypothetical protein